MRVAISIWAPFFEKSRKWSCPTAPRPISAAILIGLIHRAWVVASSCWSLQLRGALPVNVGVTFEVAAHVGGWAEFHRDVESIDKRNVDIVQVIGLV